MSFQNSFSSVSYLLLTTIIAVKFNECNYFCQPIIYFCLAKTDPLAEIRPCRCKLKFRADLRSACRCLRTRGCSCRRGWNSIARRAHRTPLRSYMPPNLHTRTSRTGLFLPLSAPSALSIIIIKYSTKFVNLIFKNYTRKHARTMCALRAYPCDDVANWAYGFQTRYKRCTPVSR